MEQIKAKDIIKQLGADLIGKDSYRGVTLTYSWLANQFGHYGLGFLTTLIAYLILFKFTSWVDPVSKAGNIIFFTWLIFETYNFLGPLIKKKRSKFKIFFWPNVKFDFTPPWWNILFDTITDLMFFWVGAFSAVHFLNASDTSRNIIILLVVLLLPFSYYWFLTKMYIQNAVLPFQLRLSQIVNKSINKDEVKKINTFVKICLNSQGNNLLIYGEENCGKTSLSVAIATEIAIKHKKCFYTTGVKMLEKFSEKEKKKQGEESLWNWKQASTLVIDDINPGGEIVELISTQTFSDRVKSGNKGKYNLDKLKGKNIIWVLGESPNNPNFKKDWNDWIKTLTEVEPIEIDLSKQKNIV